VRTRRVFHWNPGWNQPTAELAAGAVLLTWALAGGLIVRGITRLKLRRGDDEPTSNRTGDVRMIERPDGCQIRIESYGPADAPALIFTHGWGANSTEWYYPKKHLTDRFRVVVWDLPGLGLSTQPRDKYYDLEKRANDLKAVLGTVGEKPAILVGHSIGGMITLTFCREFPEALGNQVAGLVLAHTTYTNPVRTTQGAAICSALEKPVLVPLLYLTIALWPLVWLMNLLSYVNGSARQSTERSSFAGTETRGQLDFVTWFMPHARPDVLARGMFGMLRYDATSTLAAIPVPVLVFTGDRDTTTLPEANRFIAEHSPEGRLVTLSPARHMGLIEHNREFVEQVGQFASTSLLAGRTVG
jgi:pimeloyl-ACP methyl ester carboxylesterase